ncbi:tyrosine-type recombinase/integrase [Ferrimonas balearica]|nr:tyrosine-type recombinase/integrase [Ferrimonas balearica]
MTQETLKDRLDRLSAHVTNNDLHYDGRYFEGGVFMDLTHCTHGDRGHFDNDSDGELIAALWNAYRSGQLDRVMKVRRSIGAEAYDLHSLRHTKASELAAAGHDDATIMSITGHKSVAALRVYTDAARQKARAMKAQEK